MIKCQSCGTENLDGSQFCDECGIELSQFADKAQPSEMPNFQTSIPETPFFQSSSVTSVGIPAIVEEIKPEEKSESRENHKSSGVHATLIIERGESVGTEFALSSEESTIGRWDADNGIFPDVDLDAHDPEAKVSRRHARIRRENGRYIIEDLGSTNGTFVNRGRRLIPGNAHILNDGDEIIVGKTFLRFYISE
jgi:hypothetical protein